MQTSKLFLIIAAVTAGLWAQTPDQIPPNPQNESPLASQAQSSDQPLTNAEIESMLASGLPASTVVLKIQKDAYFGLVDLDTSASALARLKEKGATEQVLNAVLWAEPYGAPLKEARMAAEDAAQQKKLEEAAAPGLPDLAGVYVKGSSGWEPLHQLIFWMPFYSSDAWMHGKHDYSIPLGSGHSRQISETLPTFFVRMPVSVEGWQIVAASFHKDQRQIRMVSHRRFDEPDTIPTSQAHAVQAAHVAGSIFTFRPETPLAPGEYALCTELPGGPGLERCYSFAILQK